MTFLLTLLIGAGALLMASALDNTPIAATFTAIVAGGGSSIDWSGGASAPLLPPNHGVTGGSGTGGAPPPVAAIGSGWELLPRTQAFGQRNPLEFFGQHLGVDVATPFHTPITALRSGVVVRAGYGPAGGEAWLVALGMPPYDDYLHLDEIVVRPGQFVAAGGMIGLSGGENAGFPGAEHPASPRYSTGPHTHFAESMQVGETPAAVRDPTPLLDQLRTLAARLAGP